MATKQQAPYRCIGIIGAVFGHKFTRPFAAYIDGTTNECDRCGMPKGGWANVDSH